MTSGESSAGKKRSPATAGRFYPADPVELSRSIRHFLREATTGDFVAPRALIVPHAGYICSGIVAAAGFHALAALPAATYTVFMMGPAHWMAVHGVGLSCADAFETPLGSVPVDADLVAKLLVLGDRYHVAEEAHAPEHCLEVELPFLQTLLRAARIVPMLFDQEADPARVAQDLVPLLEAQRHSLVLVSSDLSHYLPYAQARAVDGALLEAIAEGDQSTARLGQACGILPILTLMAIAAHFQWTPHVVDCRNSGDTCSLRNEVVGYGAVVYTE